jgi:trans-aconitate methyltransferase
MTFMGNAGSDLEFPPGFIDAVSAKDTMVWPGAERQYFEIGRQAGDLVRLAARLSQKPHLPRILDFGCGYGRVLRWLRAYYPYAEITACDIDRDAVDFCADTFGVSPAYSGTDVNALSFAQPFDLVWAGSVLTHLPLTSCADAVARMISWTSDCGLIVFSTQGRYFETLLAKGEAPFADNVEVQRLRASYKATRKAYEPYYEAIDGNYGLTLFSPSALAEILERNPDIILKAFLEQAWGVQDITILYKKPGYFAPSLA